MLPVEKGAYCKACAKVVVDFSRMTDDEVKNYFIDHAAQKTCGRFRNDQLTPANQELSHVLAMSIPVWKKIVAAVFILFGSLLSSCGDRTMGKMTAPSDISGSDEKVNVTTGFILDPIDSMMISKDEVNFPVAETIESIYVVGALAGPPEPLMGAVIVAMPQDSVEVVAIPVMIQPDSAGIDKCNNTTQKDTARLYY